MRPSAAFGDGSHPTTLLCARAVDVLCRTRRPAAVLDVGTGTGVLARVARREGATFVVGTDCDAGALAAARANAALDATADIVFATAPPDAWGARFDLVVANILAGVLLELAPAIRRALVPGGVALLSGFTPPEAPVVRAAFAAHGFVVELQATRAGWVLLQMRAA